MLSHRPKKITTAYLAVIPRCAVEEIPKTLAKIHSK